MIIIPVGIYGPYPVAGEASSCYLVQSGKTKVVLDFGSGSLSKIQSYIDPRTLDAIIFSHLHYDHMCDVLPFSYMMNPNKIKIFAPATPTEVFSLLKNRDNFNLGVIGQGSIVEIGSLIFEFCEVTHPVETYAIRVTEKGGNSFVYTGDVSCIGKLVSFCKESKLIICDCLGLEGSPHMTVEGGAILQKETGAAVLASHINPDYDQRREAKAAGIEMIESGKKILV